MIAAAVPAQAVVKTGIIGTLVGGSNGDGFPAVLARVSADGIAVDGDGDLYIADTGNHRIRRIDAATSIISTIAGQGQSGYAGDGRAATEALLSGPESIAVDADNNVYFSDRFNHRVRRIDADSGVITTIIGNGTPSPSGVAYPAGLRLLADGSLLVADSTNDRILEWHPNGSVTTVAGTGEAGFSGDGMSAMDARLADPFDVVADQAGSLYIADTSNCRIRRVDGQTGRIDTIAGNGECLYAGDGPDARTVPLNGPARLALDRNGILYVAEQNAPRVRAIDLSTGAITTAVGTGEQGTTGDGGPAADAKLMSARGLLIDRDGLSLYVADFSAGRIRRVDPIQRIFTPVGAANGDGFPAAIADVTPQALAWDGAGNLYIADSIHHRLRRVRSDGTIETIAGTGSGGYNGDGIPAAQAQLDMPSGLAVDGSGNIYVSEQTGHRVRRIDAQSGLITSIAGTGEPSSAGVAYPAGLSIAADGGVLIADNANNRVLEWTAQAGVRRIAGTGEPGFAGDGGPATAARLANPLQATSDAAGNIYIADFSNCRIRRVAAQTNVIVTIAGTGECGFSGDGPDARLVNVNGPGSLALHPSGTLFIGELPAPRVRAVDLGTGEIVTVAGTGSPGSTGDGGPATAARFDSPAALLVRSAPPTLYIADPVFGRVRAVELVGATTPTQTAPPTVASTPTRVPPTATPSATRVPTTLPPSATRTPIAVATATRTPPPSPSLTSTSTARPATPSKTPGNDDVPARIDGLRLWLDSNQLTGLGDGAPVETWRDHSDGENDATQATAVRRPTLRLNALNGRPVVRFDGIDDVLDAGEIPLYTAGQTIFVVARPAGVGNQVLVGQHAGVLNGSWYFADSPQGLRYVIINQAGMRVDEIAPERAAGRFGIWVARYDGKELRLFANGMPVGKPLRQLGAIRDADQRVLVGDYGGPGWTFSGDIAQVLIYDRALGKKEREMVESYLANRTGIEIRRPFRKVFDPAHPGCAGRRNAPNRPECR